MCRSGQGDPLDATSCPDDLAARAFDVAKNKVKDRFIGDRRPLNAASMCTGCSGSPDRTRFSDCFCGFGVNAERLPRHAIGPRLPRSWSRDLDNEALAKQQWHYPDLFLGSAVSSVNPHEFCQLAMAGAIMGDWNAVYVVEGAHRRQLVAEALTRNKASVRFRHSTVCM